MIDEQDIARSDVADLNRSIFLYEQRLSPAHGKCLQSAETLMMEFLRGVGADEVSWSYSCSPGCSKGFIASGVLPVAGCTQALMRR